MILLVPKCYLSRIFIKDELQRIGCAEWRIHGKHHVPAIVTHDSAKCSTFWLRGLAFHFQQEASVLDKKRNGAYLPNQCLTLADNQPDTHTL